MYILSLDHPLGVGTLVHDIDLRDHTDRPDTFGIDLSGHLQTVRGSHIGVRRQRTQNDGP